MGPVPARPLLAPVDEESVPMEDGEGGEDESTQEGAEEGRRPLFRKSENDPHGSGGGRRGPRNHPRLAIDYGFLKANDPDDPADQGSNPILIGAEAK